MGSSVGKSRALLVAAMVAPLLAFTAACGGSDDASGKDAEKRPGSGSSASPEAGEQNGKAAGPVLDEAALKKALLADGEVKGYQVAAADQESVTPKADRDECRPLADLTAHGTGRTPRARAFATQGFAGTGQGTAGRIVTVSLLSYDGDGAARTVEGVRSAIEACGDGFTTSGNNGGETVRYTAVEEIEAPEGGDEAVAVRLVGEAEGTEVPMHFAVVRSGASLAQFMGLNIKSPSGASVPRDIVTAQVDKLAGTAAG
ncbi:PknH-like extracellular domain-containing protein [Streptomyces pini]|uniref:PknH-like extracellular domain-containing protein n=1 Tax=Streptomyces pini TaxID=1520580 RepID=A0A1I3YJG7_9ACTN|nr:PknH-like extracellular domain-containing protein [Streptomyces pini]